MSLIEVGFRSMAVVIADLRRRNQLLATRNGQLLRARDEWRVKAIKRRDRIEYLERQLKKCRERMPRRKPGPKERYTPTQWDEHARIVQRIKSIPVRYTGE